MENGLDTQASNSIRRTAETESAYLGPDSVGSVASVTNGREKSNALTAGYTKTSSADHNIIDMPMTSGERTLNQADNMGMHEYSRYSGPSAGVNG